MGDKSCVPCISYRKIGKMQLWKNTFFRLNYGNVANQNMFVNKLDT